MALPGSGAISFDTLRTERAGGGTIALSDMYRGGSSTPVTAGTTNIPASGAIDMADFYGQQLYPYGLTFLCANLATQKVTVPGFSLGTNNQAAAGSSNGSFRAGNGTRIIMVSCELLFNTPPIFYIAQKTTSSASNSSDVHGGSIGGISGATVTLRNGTATSGSSLYSNTLNSFVSASNASGILTNSSAYQANNQVSWFQINGGGNLPTVSAGNTYTWTFG